MLERHCITQRVESKNRWLTSIAGELFVFTYIPRGAEVSKLGYAVCADSLNRNRYCGTSIPNIRSLIKRHNMQYVRHYDKSLRSMSAGF
jgi:hypothetical protein